MSDHPAAAPHVAPRPFRQNVYSAPGVAERRPNTLTCHVTSSIASVAIAYVSHVALPALANTKDAISAGVADGDTLATDCETTSQNERYSRRKRHYGFLPWLHLPWLCRNCIYSCYLRRCKAVPRMAFGTFIGQCSYCFMSGCDL